VLPQLNILNAVLAFFYLRKLTYLSAMVSMLMPCLIAYKMKQEVILMRIASSALKVVNKVTTTLVNYFV
jgi:hypothetical protein